AAILNPLFQRFPTHPGLAHYIIHANDSPQLAALGLDAARRYAAIAPAAPHAQHMPSHIFIRRGLWDETIAANQRAFQARVDYAAAAQLPVRSSGMTIGAALSHFARGIGAARVSDTAQARLAIAALAAIEADMTHRGDNDWARVVAIKRQLVTAWTELAAGDTAAALRDVKGAA